MLKRVQKEVRELKKKSAKRYEIIRCQIVSTYFLHGTFKVLSSVVFWFDSAHLRATTEHFEDMFTLHVVQI